MTDRHPDDERLHELLSDAVSGVEPTPGLEAIRSRTKVHPMSTRRPWILGAGAAVLATAATITAVSLAGNNNPAGPDDTPAAAGPTSSTSSTPKDRQGQAAASAGPTATAGSAVPVYYVGDTSHGPRLYREFHNLPTAPTDDAVAQGVHEAVAGSPQDPDYASLWPQGADVQHVERSSGTIVVDLGDAALLRDRPAGMSQQQAEESVQQVVYTAQAGYQDRAPVQFLLDGRPTDTVLGVPTSKPVSQGDAIDVLAQVWIIDPTQGAQVSSGFKVDGLAAAFEANVQWELKQGAKVVKKGFTTAKECCTMAPYSFTVDAPPGDYTLVVHDSDSGGEGPAPWQDTKDVTITQ